MTHFPPIAYNFPSFRTADATPRLARDMESELFPTRLCVRDHTLSAVSPAEPLKPASDKV